MQVPFRRFDIKMTQQIFDVFNIGSPLQQMGSKTVPQAVDSYFFSYSCPAAGIGKYLLYGPGRIGSTGLFTFK